MASRLPCTCRERGGTFTVAGLLTWDPARAQSPRGSLSSATRGPRQSPPWANQQTGTPALSRGGLYPHFSTYLTLYHLAVHPSSHPVKSGLSFNPNRAPSPKEKNTRQKPDPRPHFPPPFPSWISSSSDCPSGMLTLLTTPLPHPRSCRPGWMPALCPLPGCTRGNEADA